MSIERLESVVDGLREQRYSQPRGVDRQALARDLGTDLPSDYIELAEYYPGLVVAEFLYVSRPAPGDEQDFVDSLRTDLEALEGLRDSDMTHGYDVFPQPGGLLGWGASADGDEFY